MSDKLRKFIKLTGWTIASSDEVKTEMLLQCTQIYHIPFKVKRLFSKQRNISRVSMRITILPMQRSCAGSCGADAFEAFGLFHPGIRQLDDFVRLLSIGGIFQVRQRD